MRIYLAGLYSMGLHGYTSNKAYIDRRVWQKYYTRHSWALESYHYIQNERVLPSVKKRGESIFLDSGAFSMFTKNIEVNLEAYADFIKKHKKQIHVASNLDVIGRGNEKGTWANQKALERLGAEIAPVHHARDDDKWLHKYIAEGYEYIFLGGMVPESTEYLKNWLDRIWGNIITDKSGRPKVKIHGFGLTTGSLLLRYPWFSVDSTTWAYNAGMGMIQIPSTNPNKVVQILPFSAQSPARKKRGMHYDTISDIEREAIDRRIKAWGFKKKRLRNYASYRRMWNIRVYQELERSGRWPETFINNNKGLFP